jgi:hypothetical protein
MPLQKAVIPQPSINSLDRVRNLYPIDGIVVVGTGSGANATMYMAADTPAAVLIEANAAHAGELADLARGHSGWAIHSAVVSDADHEVDFHIASNSTESSLIAPAALAPLWKNLTARRQERRSATTLAQLIGSSSSSSAQFNWIVIDCLPSLPILGGAGELLLGADVVVVRVIMPEHLIPNVGASKAECDLFLTALGFRCIDVGLERHPMVGRALYVRDWKVIAKNASDKLRAGEQSIMQMDLEHSRIESESLGHQDRTIGLSAELDALKAELRSLQLSSETLEKKANNLRVELAASLASLAEKRMDISGLRTDLTHRVDELARANGQQSIAKESMANLQERLLQATDAGIQAAADLKEQQRQTNHWTQQLAEVQRVNATLVQSVADLGKEKAELLQAARISNKLQALGDADIHDLRSRYEVALRAQEHQHVLLVELESKLQVAARYFRQLQSAPRLAADRLILGDAKMDHAPKRARRVKSAAKEDPK